MQVVLAAKGYPGSYTKGTSISKLDGVKDAKVGQGTDLLCVWSPAPCANELFHMSANETRGTESHGSQQDTFGLQVFHAGTSTNADGSIIATGGRVLGVTALADTVALAQQKAYKVLQFLTRPSSAAVMLLIWHVHACLLNQTCRQQMVSTAALPVQAVDQIHWPEGFCRRDIGWRAVEREI